MSPLLVFFFPALILCDFRFFPVLPSIDKALLNVSCGVGDDEPALFFFILSDAEGPGVADECRTETAVRVARYQEDYQGESGYGTRTTNCYRYREGALCFGLPVVFIGFLPKSGILLFSQNQVHAKTNYKTHPRSPAVGQAYIVTGFG